MNSSKSIKFDNQKANTNSNSKITIRKISSQELKTTRNQAYSYLVK